MQAMIEANSLSKSFRITIWWPGWELAINCAMSPSRSQKSKT